MTVVRSESERRFAPLQGRRRFLAGIAAAALALPFLEWGRKAGAQVYYDQYGQPVTVPPGTMVTPAPGTVATPVAPAPAAAPPPDYGYYGPPGS